MKNDKPQETETTTIAAQAQTLHCPFCGHDRFQRHERGKFVLGPNAEYPFVADEVAVLCLKCQVASLESELVA